MHTLLLLPLVYLCFAPKASCSHEHYNGRGPERPDGIDNSLTPDDDELLRRDLQWTQFYYALTCGPSSSNGIMAGAPTDVALMFGSAEASLEQAMDPTHFGLAIPTGGQLVLDLSKHFIYDTTAALKPNPNDVIELASGWQNRIYGKPCTYASGSPEYNVVCGEWTAKFGKQTDGTTNYNQIIIIPPSGGMHGQRAADIGIKMLHLHPNIDNGKTLYRNAIGRCSANTDQKCASDADCSSDGTCQTKDLSGSITATVHDSAGKVLQAASQSVAFQTTSGYGVFPSNFAVTKDRESNEMIDYQRVQIGEECLNQQSPTDMFSDGECYSPRFYLAGPQGSNGSYPQPKTSQLHFIISSGQYASMMDGSGREIGNVTLTRDPEWGEASLVGLSGVHAETHVLPGVLGGSIFGIGFKTDPDYGWPGTYTVRVQMHDGASAESHFIVEAAPTPRPTPAPTVPRPPTGTPTQSPTRQPQGIPTLTPSAAPTRSPIKPPSASPTMSPALPSNAPTRAPTEHLSQSPSSHMPTHPPTVGLLAEPTIAPPHSVPVTQAPKDPEPTIAPIGQPTTTKPTALDITSPSREAPSSRPTPPEANDKESSRQPTASVPSFRPTISSAFVSSSMPTAWSKLAEAPTSGTIPSVVPIPATASATPSLAPSRDESFFYYTAVFESPTNQPSAAPLTSVPSTYPSFAASASPTTDAPSFSPTNIITTVPTGSLAAVLTSAEPTNADAPTLLSPKNVRDSPNNIATSNQNGENVPLAQPTSSTSRVRGYRMLSLLFVAFALAALAVVLFGPGNAMSRTLDYHEASNNDTWVEEGRGNNSSTVDRELADSKYLLAPLASTTPHVASISSKSDLSSRLVEI